MVLRLVARRLPSDAYDVEQRTAMLRPGITRTDTERTRLHLVYFPQNQGLEGAGPSGENGFQGFNGGTKLDGAGTGQ